MARGKKKEAPKRYTLLWFLELLFYGFYWNSLVRSKLTRYFVSGWIFSLFPSLKRRHALWYQKRNGTIYEEDSRKFFHDPVSGFDNWYAGWAMVGVLYAILMGLFNLLCMVVEKDLYRVIHPLVPFVMLGVVTSGSVGYLDWGCRHLPYFNEFAKLSRSQKRWLGWGCMLLLLGSVTFFVLTLGLSEMYLASLQRP